MLHVHFLPSLVPAEELAGSSVVVIDVLRASTTIAHALAAGAAEVIPCLEVDEARRLAASLPQGTCLLGGERLGLPIEGFDLANSPADYTPQAVAGKTIVFTTTNGTRALEHCRQAAEVLIGGFVNLSALAERLARQRRVDLVCAGTRGRITREDVLLAGALAARLCETGSRPNGSAAAVGDLPPGMSNDQGLNDQGLIAADAWRQAAGSIPTSERIAATLRDTQGGRNLKAIGLEADIDLAAQIDRLAIVPRWDPRTGRIVST